MSEDSLRAAVSDALTHEAPAHVGVAVSGGGDSVALLLLVREWARASGARVSAVTVDHGLRPESAREAEFVAELCAGLEIAHTTLCWSGWDGQGNLQAAARAARYALIGEWAVERSIPVVALGHTQDDQAETLLMRLARGSGIDGLAGMRRRRERNQVVWLRPLLDRRRDELRGYLSEREQAWIDDPSNEDRRYDRVQMRQALQQLTGCGITVEGLADTAWRLGMARDALQQFALSSARRVARVQAGDVVLNQRQLQELPYETQLRLVAHALCWVSSADYRPRLRALTDAYRAALDGERRSLHGCLLLQRRGELRISREYQAVRDLVAATDAVWDGRWQMSGPVSEGLRVRALGEGGLRQCPDWRMAGLPRTSVLASPSVWQGDKLVAAPLAGFENGWQAELTGGDESFFEGIIRH